MADGPGTPQDPEGERAKRGEAQSLSLALLGAQNWQELETWGGSGIGDWAARTCCFRFGDGRDGQLQKGEAAVQQTQELCSGCGRCSWCSWCIISAAVQNRASPASPGQSRVSTTSQTKLQNRMAEPAGTGLAAGGGGRWPGCPS